MWKIVDDGGNGLQIQRFCIDKDLSCCSIAREYDISYEVFKKPVIVYAVIYAGELLLVNIAGKCALYDMETSYIHIYTCALKQ
jgi:hypothetical protein